MLKKLPELSLLVPIIYSYTKLLNSPTLSDSLIVGFLSLVSVSLFFIRYKESTQVSTKSEDLVKLESEYEKERLKISIEEMKYQANKNRVMRDNMEGSKNVSSKGFVF